MDLNQLSPEEIVDLAYALEDEMNKEASEQGDIDLNELSADEIIDLGYALQEEYYGDDLEKEAGLDLNELSVDEFIEVAAHLEEEMDKEAMMKNVRRGVSRAGELLSGRNVRGNVREVAGDGSKMKAYMGILRGKKGNKMMTSEARKSLAAQVGAGSIPVAGGAYAMKRRRRKSRR